MEKLFILLNILYLCYLTQLQASEIPVLLWTNNRGVQYPVSLSGHTLASSDFGNGYLEQIAEDASQNVAVFLQDKLSLEDITKYGDVYNEQSDGSAFPSVMDIFEKYESTHLPSVKAPADAVTKLQKKFKGKVHVVQNQAEVEHLAFEKDVRNLVVVNLPKSAAMDRKNALKESDGIIGQLTKRLAGETRPFSAVYTARDVSPQSAQVETNFMGRHLLADKETKNDSDTYSLFPIGGCVLLYFKQMSLTVTHHDGTRLLSTDNTTFVLPVVKNDTQSMIKDVKCGNNTAQFTIDYTGHLPNQLTKFSTTMSMKVSRGYWMINDWNVTYDGSVTVSGTSTDVKGENVKLDSHNDVIYGTIAYSNKGAQGYSYFCGDQPPIRRYSRNPETDEGKNQVQLAFKDLQMQYQPKNSTFGPPNHCSTLFTGAIWAGIIVMLLMTMILAFGVAMVMNITTMDRFDDPKGKNIQVNVSE